MKLTNVMMISGICLYRSLPNVVHAMEQVKGGADKLVALRDVLARHRNKQLRTLIFCNTVSSCRAVEFAINQDSVVGGSFSERRERKGDGEEDDDQIIYATSYHGELSSSEREHNLERYRNGKYINKCVQYINKLVKCNAMHCIGR